MSAMGLGVFHSGIEVFGSEYYFAGGASTGSGVLVQKPKTNAGPWKYQESIVLGDITYTSVECRDILNELRAEFKANTYDLTGKNCNHFTSAVSKRLLERDIPGWVNRAAGLGEALKPLAGDLGKNLTKAKAANPYGLPSTGKEFVEGKQAADYYKANNIISVMEQILQPVNGVNVDTTIARATAAFQNTPAATAVRSEDDPQMIFQVKFRENVALTHVWIYCPNTNACPKTVKFFKNNLSMDFDDCEDTKPTGEVTCLKHDVNSEQRFSLNSSDFDDVSSLTIFVENNYDEEEEEPSEVFGFKFWGRDKKNMDMKEFKACKS